MDNDSIDGLLKFEPPWREELARWRRQKAEGSATATPSKYALVHAPFCMKASAHNKTGIRAGLRIYRALQVACPEPTSSSR